MTPSNSWIAVFAIAALASAASAQVMEWVPVNGTGPHTIDGNTITVADNCSQQVTLEIRLSGWTPHLLNAYQVTVDSTGYSSGTGVALNPLGWPANQALGAFVDEDHPDYVFSGLDGVNAENTVTLDYIWVAALSNSADSRVDDGGTFYGGTLILEVPAGAAGSYTISIDPDPNQTILLSDAGAVIGPPTLVPAVITVSGGSLCCTSADCDDGDGCTIDTCDATGVCAHDPDPCDDGNPCTDDSCDPAAEQCVNDPHPCTSNVDCPIEGICENGVCLCGCSNHAQCDDGLFCTGAETCDTATGACASSGNPCAGTALPACDEAINGCIVAIPTIQWLPVASTGPHTIDGNTITVADNCSQQVTMEIRLSGWTPQLLAAYQVTVDSTGYSSGTGVALNPLGWPANQALGAFVDEDHPDFVFSGLEGVSAESTVTLDYKWLAALFNSADSRVDDGGTFYGGTLILEVPAGAAGSYTISIDPDPNVTLCTSGAGAVIGPLTFVPAVITVSGSGTCCNSADCDDGLFCTGAETCETATGPCASSGDPCAGTALPVCDEASDSCVAAIPTIQWLPVASTGPHTIDGNTITVADNCSQQVTMEVRLSGWTPHLLQAYQVTVDSTGYSSGTGLPLNPLGWPANQALGAFVDEDHPDYVFSGLEGLSAENTTTLDYAWFAALLDPADSRVDDGGTFYGGTLILEVPAGAAGSYTISIDPDPNVTTWISGAGAVLGPLTSVPAVITVSGSSLCCSSADCDDEDACTIDTCDAATGVCVHDPDPCDDGKPCTDDSCDTATGQCVNDPHPCSSNEDCPIEGICTNDVCECGCTNDAQCDDGFFCTGAETCDIPTGSCASSGDPCAGTALPVCDEAIDSCIPAVPTIQWVPVSGTGPHAIDGNTITVADDCPQQVTMEIRLSGWTPQLLQAYQVTVDSTGYSSGTGLPLNPLGWPANQALGAFVDEDHPDYVFFGLEGLSAESTVTLDYKWLAVVLNSADSRADDGGTFYGGTLILEVPAGAAGSYTISIDPDPNVTLCTDDTGANIGPLTLVPAVVTVSGNSLCCTSADCDDEDACTIDTCDTGTGECVHDPDPCDDDNPCTDDSCNTAAQQCVNDPHPCASNADCPIEGICENGVCDCGCSNDAQCDDGLFCTGAETCDTATGACASSGNPCAGTALPVCDEAIDTCSPAVPTIQWLPVASTGPHAIDGNTITVADNSPQQVTMEIRLSGWTPQLLAAYQVTVDSTGYSSGTGVALNPLGWPANQALGAFVDEDHPDYVFSGLDGVNAENTVTLDYSWLAALSNSADSPVDDGVTFYGGTLILEVPAGAAGSYTISFDPDPNLTIWLSGAGAVIGPLTLVPAVVTVATVIIPKMPGRIGGVDHDIRKNRFISIAPTTNGAPVSLKVELLDLACSATGQKCNNAADCKTCDANSDDAGAACTISSDCPNGNCVVSGETCDQQSAPVTLGWVGDPVDAGNSAPIGTFASLVVKTPPPARAWTESVVHIMGCPIAPKETYGISATMDGVLFSDPLVVGTITKPLGKDWADLVGNFDGVTWSAPNGLVSVDDVSAMIKFITLKPAPHITVVDLAGSPPKYVNFLINATDLGLVLKGFQGETFPPLADVLAGYPANGDVTQCP